MNEHTQPAHEAVNAAAPAMTGEKCRPPGESPACSGSFARVAPLIMNQPGDVDLSELLRRLKRREL